MESEDDVEFPVPKENEELVDLKYIHWGYLNCCQTLSKGRKAKREVWNTYWVTLCGTTLRFYLDTALSVNTVLQPPPSSSFGPLPENQHKVAFFELVGAEVNMLNDGKVFRRRMKKTIYSKIYRRHLFQVKLHRINSYYAFQAHSQSSYFTWLSKLQESVDAIENHKISYLAEERLQLAQFIMEKKLRSDIETRKMSEEIEAGDDSFSIVDVKETSSIDLHPKLRQLKAELKEKQEFLWQIEAQIIDFLGNKGDFNRQEFACYTIQDYYLVPGRMDTFIPSGTKVNIFGQLPNKRWRCLVEMDDLIQKMNKLVEDLDQCVETTTTSSNSIAEDHVETTPLENAGTSGEFGAKEELKNNQQNREILERQRKNIPNYPLFGSLPTSVLDIDSRNLFRELETPLPDDELTTDPFAPEPEETEPIPYSAHKREKRSTPVKPFIESDLHIEDLDTATLETESGYSVRMSLSSDNTSLLGHNRDSSSIMGESNFEDQGNRSNDSDLNSDQDSECDNTGRNFMRREGFGFVIRKRLRQKGISIIVGSSSSEDEDEEEISTEVDGDKNNNDIGYTNALYRKLGPNSKNDNLDSYQTSEDHSYIRTRKHNDLKHSKSATIANDEFSTGTDILKQYGQRSLHLPEEKEHVKVLFQKLHSLKGPDVRPPRNERRTLKLNKTDNEGFGFWLQTYGFDVQKQTLVRYVEDEGPAYLSGLREGDILLEINDNDVQDMEHAEIVNIIKKECKELKLVVKFTDAVHRVELEIRLRKKQAKLKTKMNEMERLKKEEYNLLNGITPDDTSGESMEGEVNSLCTSTESEISSISSVSDEVTVRTSKFGKRSSQVLDSIKELSCNEAYSAFTTNDLNRVSTTTEDELLNLYGERSDYTASLPRASRLKSGLKRTESMPVQKYQSLPRKRFIDLDGSHAREYAIDYSITGYMPTDPYVGNDSLDYCGSEEESSDESWKSTGEENSRKTKRRSRPKSYKMAMHSSKKIMEGEINQV